MNNNNRVHDIKKLKPSILPCGHTLDDNAELYYFCKECKDYQLKINTARDKNDKKLVGLFLIVSIAIGIIIPPILYSIVKTTMVFSIFYMALTIAVILFAPLVFTFHNWDRTIVGKSAAKTLLQINATIIIGILFFLQLNPTPSVVLVGDNQNLQPTVNNQSLQPTEIDKEFIKNPKILLASLTALCLIPFALSAIIIAIWGGEIIWQRSEMAVGKLNPHSTTGTQLGATFMIAGFMWIIITMLILVYIIPNPNFWKGII